MKCIGLASWFVSLVESPPAQPRYATLAQLVEQLIRNQ